MNERIGYPEFITVKEELDTKYEDVSTQKCAYITCIQDLYRGNSHDLMSNFCTDVQFD